MMKRFICAFLAVVLIGAVVGTVLVRAEGDYLKTYTHWKDTAWSGSAAPRDAFKYHYESGFIVIDGIDPSLHDEYSVEKIEIYAKYNGKMVRFADGALSSLPAKTVVFKEGFYHLPDGLFKGNVYVEEVQFPLSLKEIRKSVFEDCVNLVNVGEINAEIIGDRAFAGCTKLNATLGSKVLNIQPNSFENCPFVIGVERFFETNHSFQNGEMKVDGITYALKGNEVWVVDCDEQRYGEVVLPDMFFEKYPVTKIVYPGFNDCRNITKVVLPKSMKILTMSTFWGCSNLREVVLNEGLISIGNHCFEYCSKLKSITIPDSVKFIEELAFYESGLEKIDLGKGVTTIGDGAFFGCKKLESIVIPDSVVNLGTEGNLGSYTYWGKMHTTRKESPFYLCDNLKAVVIGKNVEKIYPNTFINCPKLSYISVSSENKNYTSVDGVVYTKDMKEMVAFPQGKNVSKFTVPEGVCKIGDGVIQTNTLKELYIPESLKDTGYGNRLPEKVEVYKSIDSVPEDALKPVQVRGIYNNIEWNIENGVLTFTGQGSLTGNTKESEYKEKAPIPWKIEDVKEVVIGEGIYNIIHGVFENHYNLEKVTLPSSLTAIYEKSFYKCSKLESITIPYNVTCIGEKAFGECYNLKEVHILADKNLQVYRSAFDIADGAVLYLSNKVDYIDSHAFTHSYDLGEYSYLETGDRRDVIIVAERDSYAYSWAEINNVKIRTPNESIDQTGVEYTHGEAAFNSLGIKVSCDNEKKIAVCGEGQDWMIFKEGDSFATTANGKVDLVAPVKWIDGVFSIPVKTIEQLGYNDVLESDKSVEVNLGNENAVNKEALPNSIRKHIFTSEDIRVSQVPESANGQENLIDGSTQSRWAANVADKENPAWAVFDLKKIYELDRIGLSFFQGATRTTEFKLEISIDGVNYTDAVTRRQSSGTTDGVEYYLLKGKEARYIRLLGYGNSSQYSYNKTWFSPTEFEVYIVGEEKGEGYEVFVEEVVSDSAGKVDLKADMITTSILTEPQNGPANLIDGNYTSYCVLYVPNESLPEYIQIDLRSVKDVSKIGLAFRFAKSRNTVFDIKVSEDGKSYKTVISKRASGSETDAMQYFGINEKARYIRIYGYSNTFNKYWVSITEAEVYVNE